MNHVIEKLQPEDSKHFMSNLKKVLADVKQLQTGQSPYDEFLGGLFALVEFYLKCPSKFQAKRLIASFFQNHDEQYQDIIKENLCGQLLSCFPDDFSKVENVSSLRQAVDNINFLLENFAFGERCLANMLQQSLNFLVQVEEYFLSQVNKDVSPVYLNEVMHHCLVTMQTLNLVLQKSVMDKPIMKELAGDFEMMSRLVQTDIRIIQNELLLLDCRCCCAMNVFLLIQISCPMTQSLDVIPDLLFPNASGVQRGKDESLPPWLSDRQDVFMMDKQTSLSFLAIAFGFIAMTTPHKITQEVVHGKLWFIDNLLPNLLKHGEKCEDTVSKALHGKTVNLWTNRLVSSISGCTSLEVSMTQRLQGDSPTLQSLLQYVLTHWEDQLDVVRQSANTVFDNVLKIHMTAGTSNTEGKPSGQSPSTFVSFLLTKLFNVSWTSRGKFNALSSCVRFIGAGCLLAMRDNFPSEVLTQFHDKSLSCYATELYMNTLTSHSKELSPSPPANDAIKDSNIPSPSMIPANDKTFLNTWIEPVITALYSSNTQKKNNIVEYLLPRLLKSDKKLLDHMVKRLSIVGEDESNHDLCYGAIIACLRRARVMGLLTLTASPVIEGKNDSKLWLGSLDPKVLKTTLCVLDEQSRLDAFAFLCECNKATEVVSGFEFEMLRLFVPSNLNSQSPAFRQTFLSFLKKLFTRLKNSLPPLKKLAERKKIDVSEYIENYKSFLEWTTSLMLANLHPGAAFARRTTCLTSLSLMNSIFTKEDGFTLSSYLTKPDIDTLLKCLADTFEENNKESLTILTIHAREVGWVTTQDRLLSLYHMALSLACSTRPQDCGTAAYIMLLLLKQRDIFSMIKNHPINLKTNTAKALLSKVNTMFASCPITEDIDTTQSFVSIYLLHILVIYLHDQNEIAGQSLITAAANRPMYPTLQCIRYIMQEIKWKSYPPNLVTHVRHFIQLLIQTCLDLSRVVSPVVQNSSPEGNIPAEAILGPGLNLADILPKSDSIHISSTADQQKTTLSQSILSSQLLVESMPEYLIVCCWRSIKEVSLTLGKMCLQIPVSAIVADESNSNVTENTDTILSLTNIQTVGDYFTQQLLESVHRGAFELAYAGFQLMCQMLWNHPHPDLHRLPTQWLMQVISDIKSEDPKLCATRRSAGVPFFIQAVTSSEPFLTGRQCFHSAMKELIGFALDECETKGGPSKTNKDAQVHALNILRALYKDSRLREDVVPYIADGVKAAISGFKSSLWSVRNSATLLLSALMTRMFGVKRSKDETAISKKNCQTGRSFFYHYPSLYSFLLSELEEATMSMGETNIIQLHPSLYPVLLVLGRLFPSMLEGADTSLSLSAFIPYVLKCSSSPVLKTRIIAARALQPLARRNEMVNIAKMLFINIPPSRTHGRSSSSHIHGSLLQLCQLVKLVKDFNASLQEQILIFFVEELQSRTWLMSQENECFALRQCMLQLVDAVLDIVKLVGSTPIGKKQDSVEILKTSFITSLSKATTSDDRWKPLVYEYEQSRAMFSVKYLTELEAISNENNISDAAMANLQISNRFKQHVILNFLQSSFYEVRLQILCMLVSALTGQSQEIKYDEEMESEEKNTNMESSSEVADVNGHTLADSFNSDLDITTRNLLRTTCVHLFDQILHLAVDVEDHHECSEKIFHVLTFTPNCDQLLQKENTTNVHKIFATILEKFKTERRNEVKAALLRFTGRFIPFLYGDIMSEGGSFCHSNPFRQWSDVIQACSQKEEYPDLQISVCHILLDNADTLLCDKDHRLGLLSLQFWTVLASLLQEDDLEVKDIAASILAVVSGLDKGSLHPTLALEKVPETLMSVHKDKHICDMTRFLVSWVVCDVVVDIKELNERLFDKSEMNTYKDYIAFTRCVVKTLKSLFHQETCPKDTTKESDNITKCATPPNVTLIKHLQTSEFIDFLIHTFDKLQNELTTLQQHCEISDPFMNPSRHTSLYHAIFRAEGLITVFKDVYRNENTIQSKMSELRAMTSELMENFNVCHNIALP